MTELLTPLEVARILKVGKSTVYRMIEDGRLPAVTIVGTNLLRVRAEDVWCAVGVHPAAPTRPTVPTSTAVTRENAEPAGHSGVLNR